MSKIKASNESLKKSISFHWKMILSILLSLSAKNIDAQNLYDINTIQNIEITFSQSNWDYMLDTATTGSDGYIMAQSIAINGVIFDSVGVKYKGNSTYNANQVKNPFHIELDTYKNQDYQGYTDLKLSNVAKDPSFVREVLGYSILRQYMDAPLSNYATVKVNGTLIGLYVSSESVSKKFVANHFYSNDGVFFKCNPIDGAGPGSTAKPNLVYLGTDSASYYAAYEMNSDNGWKELTELCDTIKNYVGSVEKVLDVDRSLWMISFDNVTVNLDSYLGGFTQNYYLYQDHNNRFNPVIWDLNESFGTFSQTGTINLNSTTSKQQMSHTLHSSDAQWPLIQQLLSVPTYKKMYVAHMRTMLNENFGDNSYYASAQALQAIINTTVNADVNKFYTYTQYQNNLTTDVTSGMTNAPGITNLMNGRNTYLMSQADFTATPPTISSITPSSTTPALNSSVSITANITNTNSDAVYLGYRYSISDKFTKISMFDDGNHGDGTAGDNVYGASLPVNASYVQYYIYAENSSAGMFSPERAEHEFYSLFAIIPTINVGDLVINEIMASNSTTAADASGQFADWIELYNNTNNYLSLNNLYLSDNYTNSLKWAFAENITIAPNGFLVIWADNDTLESGIHSNFKLSSTGEQLILSYANGTVLDSITFGGQSTDYSFLRCPNGTGNFSIFEPSFESFNCIQGINEENQANFNVFPNPNNGTFYVSGKTNIENLIVYNAYGQAVKVNQKGENGFYEINLDVPAAGIYLVGINNQFKKVIIE
jgi:hypothetical protein